MHHLIKFQYGPTYVQHNGPKTSSKVWSWGSSTTATYMTRAKKPPRMRAAIQRQFGYRRLRLMVASRFRMAIFFGVFAGGERVETGACVLEGILASDHPAAQIAP